MRGTQISMPPISQTNRLIMMVLGIAFLLTSAMRLAGLPYATFLMLAKETFLGFQVLTYVFIEPNIMTIIFNGLLLWFIGGELEQHWGVRYYRQFLAILTISAGLIFLGLSYSPLASIYETYYGTSALVLGLLVAYGVIFGEKELQFMFFFPLKAKYFCLLIAFIQLYGAFFSMNKISALAHLLTMGLAFSLLYFKSRQKMKQRASEEFKKYQRDNLKKSFKLIKGEDENDPPRYWQ